MPIEYRVNAPLDVDAFSDLLHRSGLAARRPVDDRGCLAGMLDHANLTVTAWQDTTLVGIARAMTDFSYACYLSDLAVDKACQRQGIGKALQTHMQQHLGPRCKLILIAAPSADSYYRHLGFSSNPRCWVLEPPPQTS